MQSALMGAARIPQEAGEGNFLLDKMFEIHNLHDDLHLEWRIEPRYATNGQWWTVTEYI